MDVQSMLGRFVRLLALVLVLAAPGWWGAGTALAQQETQAQRQEVQPGNNAPVWRDVRSGEQPHYTSTKGREAGVLVQTMGETWRTLRNGWVIPAVSLLMVLGICAVAAFHWLHGPVRLEGKPSGRLIRRFTDLQRVAHWTLGISFCILAVTGLVMLVGKYLLLPVIGYALFGWLADFSKLVHNFVGPIFALSVVLMIVVFVRDTLPASGDLKWLLRLGGAFEGKHMPVGKHHAGHKVWFWGSVVVMSTIVAASGLVLDFPVFDQTRATMVIMLLIHSIAAGLLMAMSVTHIYMGTRGVEGAYEGMRFGYVDETYAQEHHVYWYQDIKAGKITPELAQGTPDAPQLLQRAKEATA